MNEKEQRIRKAAAELADAMTDAGGEYSVFAFSSNETVEMPYHESRRYSAARRVYEVHVSEHSDRKIC